MDFGGVFLRRPPAVSGTEYPLYGEKCSVDGDILAWLACASLAHSSYTHLFYQKGACLAEQEGVDSYSLIYQT